MGALGRCWNEIVFRVAAITGLPPTGRSVLLVAGLPILVVGVYVFFAVRVGQSAGRAPYVNPLSANRGLGPGWECENIPKAEVCRRIDAPARAPPH